MTFSSADYPLFLIAVFAIYALTRVAGAAGLIARVAVLVLLGDLVYLLLCKDVGALWDPLGVLAYAPLAKEHTWGPWWHLVVGSGVLAGAVWSGWRYGAMLAGARGQRAIAWGALAGVVGLGAAIVLTRATGTLGAMSAGFQTVGHLLFLVIFGCAIGAAQTDAGRPFGRVVVLLIASSLFYHAWASGQAGAYRYLLLVLLAIVVGDFLLGLAIEATASPGRRKALLLVSLVSNLGVLALFKYADFFRLSVLHTGGAPWHLILPAGISFHTFQSMSYTIDVYRKQLPACRSVVQFATFVLFFPQLVAGPIVRAQELLPQMDRLPPLDRDLAADGLFRIVVGLFKKIALADLLARVVVDRVFENPGHFSGLEVALGVVGYAFQIYLDFSAYSDIAIGSAQLLGFRFPENFRTPYRSGNLQEFWRRWHITLSSWLRDYLYIPLGGARKGTFATYRNLIITMLLGGLWHGASWTYIAWGALHGFGLAITRVFQRRADAGLPSGAWILASGGLAALGALVVSTTSGHGVLFHLIAAWIYTAPLWAAATVFLTHAPEPGTGERPPRAPTAKPTPAPSRVERRQHPAPKKSRRGKRRGQRGAVTMPRAVALERTMRSAVPILRWIAAGVAVLDLAWFISWAAAPLYFARSLPGIIQEGTVVTAVPPPGGVLWVAVLVWAIALAADVVERAPDRRLALRWLFWAFKRTTAVILTFTYVCIAWIFFRAQSFSAAADVIAQISTLSHDTGSLLPQVPIVLGVAALAHFFAPATYRWARTGFVRLPPWGQALILVGAAFSLLILAASKAQAFIYFQF